MARGILIRMAAIVVALALLIVACGPTPAPQVIKETAVIEKEVEVTRVVEVEKEVVVTATPELVVVTFMVWAEDDFEEGALREMVDRFEETHPEIKVDLKIVR